MGGKSSAKTKKSRKSGEDIPESNKDLDQPEEYKVEKIVNDRKIRGKVQYKVHWDGYNTDEETWENESQLNCDDLIHDYLNDKNKNKDENSEDDHENEEEDEKGDETQGKKGSKKRSKGVKSSPKKLKSATSNGQDEYEIEKIIEMHTLRNGKHEFLVRWYGFGKEGDTWEPEENLKGTDVLVKFLEKVKKAKEMPQKELRMHRVHTDRFTAMPQGDKRRQSKRNANRQRVKYYDAD